MNKNFTESIRSKIKDSKNNRIFADNRIYYNYYNNDLLYLCGYENQDLKNIVEKRIVKLRENPNATKKLLDSNKKFLTKKAGRGYKKVFYLKNNCYSYLFSYLLNDQCFFIGVSPLGDLSEKYKDHYFLITDLVKTDDPADWDKNVQKFFKLNSRKISGMILSPMLMKEGGFLAELRCQQFVKLCKHYNIPIIWDESQSYFYRSGSFYFLNQYNIQPDLIVINSSITLNRPFHLLITNRKFSKLLDPEQISSNEKITISILMESLEELIKETGIIEHIKETGYRLERKLHALKANTKSSFNFKVKGLITFITVPNRAILQKLQAYLRSHNILVYEKDCVLLLPQLTINNESVDLFIQILNDFFREGILLNKK